MSEQGSVPKNEMQENLRKLFKKKHQTEQHIAELKEQIRELKKQKHSS